MMRRLPGVSLAALAVTLAVAPLAFAKPPDLPQNPTIIVTQPPQEEAQSPGSFAACEPVTNSLRRS